MCPTSFRENIPQILKAIEECRPTAILDIGFGRGKYGFLVKEYYPEMKIDGLEVFKDYIKPHHKEIYGKIYNKNAFDLTDEEIKKYDLFLIIDAVEHWEIEAGRAFLDRLTQFGAKVIVSTPRSVAPQGAEYGNEWERHVSQWQGDDFTKKYQYKEHHNDLSFLFTIWK